ncbi:hypothetical protein [Sphaerochaeta globosa]|uniref:Uncharacterized protein n=1 Tax=Sphaerochaeta globosa (strain ATCC BAA-1886 / DSM 22777 / Buddy) TaxID=158189 RepID=F0RTI5_SPHGB|nr:hypothetical protein [Sphaerochaeta globosa]ADY14180.1 hypothetical protein SpiBuddy_2365 [Sphaerochaeta globosa str. Buddy]
MRTADIFLVDGKYTDRYKLEQIDATHFYQKLLNADGSDSRPDTKGMVQHVAQIGNNKPFYEAVLEWLQGMRDLQNVGFEVA